MKKLNLDGHKLHFHFDRISEFTSQGDCYPLYMEVSPVGSCNHRCVFCAYDYIGYPNRKLDKEVFIKFLHEVSSHGLRSMLYAGEGEPLLHPNITEFIPLTKKLGIDVGVFTNGQLLTPELTHAILEHLTFIRFSFNAGDAHNYAQIHEVKEKTFDKVVANMTYAKEYKTKHRLDVSLGVQFVLLPENKHSLIEAIKTVKKCGVDYISVKPFVQQSKLQHYQLASQFTMEELKELVQESQQYATKNFQVLFRENAFENYGVRDYCHCRGTSFITVLNSAGDLASCLPYWDKKEFIFGNINQESFYDIWNGEKRKKIKYFLENNLDVSQCPPNCRPHAINSFLEQILTKNIQHVNFI